MARLYSLPRDFGLNGSHRVALPEQETQQDPDAYNLAMPGSSSEERVQRRTVTFAVDVDARERKKSSRRSWSKKMRGLFKGSTKRKVVDKGRHVPAVTTSPILGGIDAVVLGGPSYGVPAYIPNPDIVGASDGGILPQATPPAWGHEGNKEPPRIGDGGQGVEKALPEGGSEEVDSGPPQLIRLTLLPKEAQSEVEVRQVTLRQKASGFGVHLSGGLPPIRVTYVEPGGEAELAGVGVGDRVMEVNGKDCRSEMDIPQIMELKMLIQRVKIQGKAGPGGEGEYENSDLEDEPADISVDDAAWQRIRQVQDDIDSQDSSNLEITNIDDVSELSSIKEEFEPKSPKEQGSAQSGVVYSKTAPALPVATSKSDEGWQQKAGKGKFGIGKKKKSPSTGDIAVSSQEPLAEGLKKGKTKGKKASKSKKKSASKDSDHREAISPVVLEDYDGGEEPRRVGGARVAAMSREDMPQLRQLALARKEGLLRRRSGSLENLSLSQEFKGELRATSRSQTDMDTVGVDLEANVRVKKSGVVIGPSSARGSRRPSIFDQEAGDVDLSAIPRLAPTLGLQEGHTRRDLAVSRSSIKRRPASKRRSLLLHAGEREKMGTARVTLSEGERRPVRTSSTPAKLMRDKKQRSSEENLPKPTSPTREGKPAKITSPTKEGKPPKLTSPTKEGNPPKLTSPTKEGKPRKLTSPTKEGKPPKPAPTRLPSREAENPLDSSQTQKTAPPRVQRQGSSGSTAEMVARATVMRKRQSFEGANEKESPPENPRRKTSSSHPHTPMGFNLLAEISNQTPGGGNGGQKKEPLSRKLFPAKEDTGKETGTSKETEFPPQPHRDTPAQLQTQKMPSPLKLPPLPPPAERPTASGSGGIGVSTTTAKPATRRFKSVEKPVKTLGIASERETGANRHEDLPPSSHDQPLLKATEAPEKRVTTSGSESSSALPSWVSIAHNKQKRISVVYGLDGTPTRTTAEPQVQKDTPTSPQDTTTPTSSPGSKPSGTDSSLPRMGHVKDRLAIFQQKHK